MCTTTDADQSASLHYNRSQRATNEEISKKQKYAKFSEKRRRNKLIGHISIIAYVQYASGKE